MVGLTIVLSLTKPLQLQRTFSQRRVCPDLLGASQSPKRTADSAFSFFHSVMEPMLNSWHISPHMLTSKIAFCQYEGKDNFGFNGVRQLMFSINGTTKNNQNVYKRLSVLDGFPVTDKLRAISQFHWRHLGECKVQVKFCYLYLRT